MVYKIFLFWSVSFDVDKDITLDLSLTGLPVIDASSVNLGLKVGNTKLYFHVIHFHVSYYHLVSFL